MTSNSQIREGREPSTTSHAITVSKGQAAKDVEVVVLSIPFAEYPDLAGLFSDVPAEVVVIDTSNYYPLRDGAIAEVDGDKPESVWVSEQSSWWTPPGSMHWLRAHSPNPGGSNPAPRPTVTEPALDGLKAALVSVNKQRAPDNRGALVKEFMASNGELTHGEDIAGNRAATA